MLIYKATNKMNGKAYVGQTVNSLKRRKIQHISEALNEVDPFYFHNAIRKYGLNNFSWEVIMEGTCSSETLNKLEKHFILLYNSFENGYNLTLGGGSISGFKHSAESRKKISEAHKGKHLSGETRGKMSKARKGEKNPMFGKYHSEESKRKVSEAGKGRKCSEETRKKLSEVHKGKNSHMFGKHLSAETRKRISESCKGKFTGKNHHNAIPVIINNNYFDTRNQAAEFINVAPSTIRCRILHKTKWIEYRYAHKGEN